MACPYPVFTTDLLLRSTDYFQEIAGIKRKRETGRDWIHCVWVYIYVYMYISRRHALFTGRKMQTRCDRTAIEEEWRGEVREALPSDRPLYPISLLPRAFPFSHRSLVLHLPKRPLCPLVFVLRLPAKSSTLSLPLSLSLSLSLSVMLMHRPVSLPSRFASVHRRLPRTATWLQVLGISLKDRADATS